MRIATDVGGTFTDLVYYDPEGGGFGVVKTDTTPPDFERGVLEAVCKAGLDAGSIEFFVHGTTVVINALTERKGVKTGLITTRGFRDVLEIARGTRPDLYNFRFSKPPPFVPRHLRLEAAERVSHKGEVLRPLQAEELDPLIETLRAEGVQAVAICFLHAYANPTHEAEAAARVRSRWPEVSVVASHEITREWREYERTSTTVLSAYIKPIAESYLASLETRLAAEGFGGQLFVMQSNGGIASVPATKENPISMVESGPVSGVLGAIALGRLMDEPNLIALDIGGTTAKCTLIKNGQARITTEYKIGWSRTNPGYPIKAPVIDIVEIGNGGGSIAWVDAAGSLHVGPRSAGASPGPAAYGRGGTEPTTTDANLLTGRINPDEFVGGEVRPDFDNIRRTFGELAERLQVSVEEAARGVIRIANANMVNALKLVSVNRGQDPRDFALVAFGGGGGMHATALARELGIPKVIVPIHPAVFSAWGMLLTDLRRDYILTRVIRLDGGKAERMNATFAELERAARAEYAADGFDGDRLIFERFADMRYFGQEHAVKVPVQAERLDTGVAETLVASFHEAHEREYRFRLANAVEVVNVHLVAYGRVAKPELRQLKTGGDAAGALKGCRRVDFDTDGIHDAAIYDRARLRPGAAFTGPAIVEEVSTVSVVLPGQQVSLDEYGNLHIRIPGEAT